MTKSQQRGATLVEALVALVIMAIGMLAVVGVQGHLRGAGEQAKQRVAAGRIAMDELERLRGAAALARDASLPADALAFSEIHNATRTVSAAETQFSLHRTVTPIGPSGIAVHVQLRWEDRQRGATDAQQLSVHSLIPVVDPGLQAAALAAPADRVRHLAPHHRHPGIPLDAKPLDENQSVFKPLEGGSDFWVFSHANGRITRQCSSAKPSDAITSADLVDCPPLPVPALLLSGHVQTSLDSPPNPTQPNDITPEFGVALALSSSPHLTPPICRVDTARPKAKGLRGADYHCAIVPRSTTAADPLAYWSGRTDLTGLPLAEGGVRVCRYSSDRNRNGSIDNSEHPAAYSKVTKALMQQNFLLVRFEQACPAGAAIDTTARQFRDTVTAQHQP